MQKFFNQIHPYSEQLLHSCSRTLRQARSRSASSIAGRQNGEESPHKLWGFLRHTPKSNAYLFVVGSAFPPFPKLTTEYKESYDPPPPPPFCRPRPRCCPLRPPSLSRHRRSPRRPPLPGTLLRRLRSCRAGRKALHNK